MKDRGPSTITGTAYRPHDSQPGRRPSHQGLKQPRTDINMGKWGDPISPKEWRKENPFLFSRLSRYASNLAVVTTLGRNSRARDWSNQRKQELSPVIDNREKIKETVRSPLQTSVVKESRIIRSGKEMARHTLLTRDLPAFALAATLATAIFAPQTGRALAADGIRAGASGLNGLAAMVEGSEASSSSPRGPSTSPETASNTPLRLAAGKVVCSSKLVSVTVTPGDKGNPLVAMERTIGDDGFNYATQSKAFLVSVVELNGGVLKSPFQAPTECTPAN